MITMLLRYTAIAVVYVLLTSFVYGLRFDGGMYFYYPQEHQASTTAKQCTENNSHRSIPVDTQDKLAKKPPELPKFDLEVAVLLAGYAFDAYNEPDTGKISMGADGTKVTYTSTEFINQAFRGLVMVNLHSGEFSYKETQLIETLATGQDPDPYVSIMIEDRGVVVDTALSSTKKCMRSPDWKENFFLYVKDPNASTLTFQVYDEDMVKEDDVIGVGEYPVSSILKSGYEKGGNLTIPLYSIPSPKKALGLPSQHRRMGTLLVDAQFIPWHSNFSGPNTSTSSSSNSSELSPEEILQTKLPGGATESCDWKTLLATLIHRQGVTEINPPRKLAKAIKHNMHQICGIDNDDTDTQVHIWADVETKLILLSFRGTEQIKFKDILTDINLIQSPYDDSIEELSDVMLHSGFLNALQSVRGSILYIIESIISMSSSTASNTSDQSWSFFITGHSLGGALASLLAFELGVLRAGIRTHDRAVNVTGIDLNSALRDATITMYSFGAPRVGNRRYVEMYDELVPDSYRVVNNKDIVPRLPRGYNATRFNDYKFMDYDHAGKAVIIDDERNETLWIQGESEGECPLDDISPFQLASVQESYQSNSSMDEPTSSSNSSLWLPNFLNPANYKPAWVDNITSNLPSMPNIQVPNVGAAFQGLAFSNMSLDFSSISSVYEGLQRGIEQTFLDREFTIFSAIMNGSAVQHHFEPSYFEALNRTLTLPSKQQSNQTT